MKPEDDGLDDLRERLRTELDSVPLAAPFAAQARYRQAAARRPGALRRLAPALAGAAAVFLIGVALGGLNPATWRSQSAGAMERFRQAIGVPAASTSPSPAVTPTPTPEAASPKPETSPEATEVGPAEQESGPVPGASPTPQSEGGGGSSDGGGTTDGGDSPTPSPSPTSDGH